MVTVTYHTRQVMRMCREHMGQYVGVVDRQNAQFVMLVVLPVTIQSKFFFVNSD